MTAHTDKDKLRKEARTRRVIADMAAPRAVAKVFARRFLNAIPIRPDAVIAGYVRTQFEADPKVILRELQRRGHDVALPAVESGPDVPLMFRVSGLSQTLIKGAYGIPAPPKTARAVMPDIVIVPIVAFDRRGYRIGYGAGYYDRALESLRARKPIIAVGLAYAAQCVDTIPREAHDQPLDWIVTEKEAIRIG